MKAQFEIKDLIVTISCPGCETLQHSPHHPGSQGWSPKDVKYIGPKGKVYCRKCHQPFRLPGPLFRLVPETTEVEAGDDLVKKGIPRTERQREILEYIRGFIERKGHQPTYMQIARHFGIRSKASIAKHISALERRGLVSRGRENGMFSLTL
jgi:tRNA G26 N,N-dimethylase Trm1